MFPFDNSTSKTRVNALYPTSKPREDALYQRRASECLELATASTDFEERRTWRELAMCWLRLCEHADRFRRDGYERLQTGGVGRTPM